MDRSLAMRAVMPLHFLGAPSRNHVHVSKSPGDLVYGFENTSSLSSFTVTPAAVIQTTPYRHDGGASLPSAGRTASRATITSGLVPLAVRPDKIPWRTPCLGEENSCSG